MKKYKIIVLGTLVLMLSACSTSQRAYVSTPSYSFKHTDRTALGIKAKKIQRNNVSNSTAYLVSEGTEAFLTRLALLKLAERSVDVQYFIWKSDLIGKMLFHGIIQAADRGVRVRLLLDDITLDDETKKILYAIDQHKYIEVRIYNPVSTKRLRILDALIDPKRINRRMHNKSFTADSQYTIVGGRNIETNYFSANERSNYADLDLISVGPVVKKVDTQFNVYWNSEISVPVKLFAGSQDKANTLKSVKNELAYFAKKNENSVYALDVKHSKMYQRVMNGIAGVKTHELYRGKTSLVYDNPQKTLGKSKEETVYLTTQMRPHIDNVKYSLELISPYFVPGKAGREYLANMVKRGIKVRVITNSLSSTDGFMAQSGYARHRLELLKAGVELYELKAEAKSKVSHSLKQSAKAKSALHAKTYIFDRKEVYIGSFNLDPRSANINTELGVVCAMPKMAKHIASTLFDDKLKDATYKVVLLSEKKTINNHTFPKGKMVWIETKESKEIYHTTQPQTSTWRRFNEKIYSILPIESQL